MVAILQRNRLWMRSLPDLNTLEVWQRVFSIKTKQLVTPYEAEYAVQENQGVLVKTHSVIKNSNIFKVFFGFFRSYKKTGWGLWGVFKVFSKLTFYIVLVYYTVVTNLCTFAQIWHNHKTTKDRSKTFAFFVQMASKREASKRKASEVPDFSYFYHGDAPEGSEEQKQAMNDAKELQAAFTGFRPVRKVRKVF